MATIKKHVSKSGQVTYYIRGYDGYDVHGKQIEKCTSWKPNPGMSEKQIQKELERQKVLFDEKIKHRQVFDGSMKFHEYAALWMENNKPPQLAPKTYERYKALLKNINLAIGNIRLDKLQSQHLQQFYSNLKESGINSRGNYAVGKNLLEVMKKKGLNRQELAEKCGVSTATISSAYLHECKISIPKAQSISDALGIPIGKLFELHTSDKGLSGKTILHHHRLISSILTQATRDRLVPYNVADKDYMKAPKIERKEAAFLDDRQVWEVISLLMDEPIKWRTALLLLIYSGMRRGELMGLEWTDIDFQNNTIDIYRTSQYVLGMGVITKDTKNASSQRVIRLPDKAFELLYEYRQWWEEQRSTLQGIWQERIEITYTDGKTEWVKNDRLFIQEDGSPMNPDSLTDWTSKFVKRHGLPPFSPHSLRHTNASLLIANGVNISTVSKRLGHSNISTTAKIYTHAIQSADEKAASVLEGQLNPLKKDSE